MSDLAATNCGGGCSCNEGGCGSILWIILLLCCCGGNGCGLNSGNGQLPLDYPASLLLRRMRKRQRQRIRLLLIKTHTDSK